MRRRSRLPFGARRSRLHRRWGWRRIQRVVLIDRQQLRPVLHVFVLVHRIHGFEDRLPVFDAQLCEQQADCRALIYAGCLEAVQRGGFDDGRNHLRNVVLQYRRE